MTEGKGYEAHDRSRGLLTEPWDLQNSWISGAAAVVQFLLMEVVVMCLPPTISSDSGNTCSLFNTQTFILPSGSVGSCWLAVPPLRTESCFAQDHDLL